MIAEARKRSEFPLEPGKWGATVVDDDLSYMSDSWVKRDIEKRHLGIRKKRAKLPASWKRVLRALRDGADIQEPYENMRGRRLSSYTLTDKEGGEVGKVQRKTYEEMAQAGLFRSGYLPGEWEDSTYISDAALKFLRL